MLRAEGVPTNLVKFLERGQFIAGTLDLARGNQGSMTFREWVPTFTRLSYSEWDSLWDCSTSALICKVTRGPTSGASMHRFEKSPADSLLGGHLVQLSVWQLT